MEDGPIATIFYVPETGYYGFRYQFAGRKPHYTIDTCPTLQHALDHCDAHREHLWEDASDANEDAIMVSRGYKEGTVMWRMTNLTLGQLAALGY